jgi:hypothetical protein
MKYTSILACLFLVVAVPFSARAQVVFFSVETGVGHGEGFSPNDINDAADAVPVSAGSLLSYRGATGSANATASQGNVHADMTATSSQGDLGTLAANASAVHSDVYFITMNGVRVSGGTLEVDAEVSGTMLELGNGANAEGNWSFVLGDDSVMNHFEANGGHHVEESLITPVTTTDGVGFELSVSANGHGLGFSDTNSFASFTANITETRYRLPSGVIATNAQITLASSLFLKGDYNNDQVVNAADYAVWRDNRNSSATLPNDVTPGTVNTSDYDVWRANFGRTIADAGGSAAAVPEPALLRLVVAAGATLLCATKLAPQWIGGKFKSASAA